MKTSNIIELVVPDQAVSACDEYFLFHGRKVRPEVRSLSQWGAEVVLGGVIYSADQEAMKGYPSAGSYYLTRNAKSHSHDEPPLVPCECGNPWAKWWGDRCGHRQYMCSACFDNTAEGRSALLAVIYP